MYTFGRLGVVPAKRKECISVLMCGAHKGETRGNQGKPGKTRGTKPGNKQSRIFPPPPHYLPFNH